MMHACLLACWLQTAVQSFVHGTVGTVKRSLKEILLFFVEVRVISFTKVNKSVYLRTVIIEMSDIQPYDSAFDGAVLMF
jgi:hypothetical protein